MTSPWLFAWWSAGFARAAPWVGLGLTTLVLIAVLRSRWQRTPVLTRCILISLYAHLLFATAAYTTQCMSWTGIGPGFGEGSRPVKVRVTSDPAWPEIVETTEPIPAAEKPEPLTPVLSDTGVPDQEPSPEPSVPPQPAAVAEAPRKAPEETPPPLAIEAATPVVAETAPRYASQVEPAPKEPSPTRTETKTSDTPSATTPTGVPELYQLRFASDRTQVVEAGGGTADTEAAVQLALAWLVANQEADGRWSAARHGAGRGAPQAGQDRGDTGVDADTGITALAILSLLGAGHTHLDGEHRESVQHGLEFLLRSQRADGCMAGSAKLFASMYCHGMATLATAEAFAITRDARLRSSLERAVAYTVKSQHPAGGWRYQPGDVGDMSQFGWQIMALKSAELAGIDVPPATYDRADRFLLSVGAGRAGGLASYRAKERPSRTMTAEALLCRHLMHESPSPAAVEEAWAFLDQESPGAAGCNIYYWYYGTLALHLSQGPRWERWNAALQRELLMSQRREGALIGSWDPDRFWGAYGGRVYQTSLSTLCLEIYYRYNDSRLIESALR